MYRLWATLFLDDKKTSSHNSLRTSSQPVSETARYWQTFIAHAPAASSVLVAFVTFQADFSWRRHGQNHSHLHISICKCHIFTVSPATPSLCVRVFALSQQPRHWYLYAFQICIRSDVTEQCLRLVRAPESRATHTPECVRAVYLWTSATCVSKWTNYMGERKFHEHIGKSRSFQRTLLSALYACVNYSHLLAFFLKWYLSKGPWQKSACVKGNPLLGR